MEILTGEQMRSVDRRAIEDLGIASLLLMESAGAGIAEALLRDRPDLPCRQLLVVCGKGNNGGDGLVIARHLTRRGVAIDAILLGVGSRLGGDPAVQLAAARASGVDVVETSTVGAWRSAADGLSGYDLILDAILGTGVRGGARGLPLRAIEALNASGVPVVSVDLPSGLDSDSATVDGPAIRAVKTYTLCRPKPALILEPASCHAGPWECVPIGIPRAAVAAECPELEWLTRRVAASLLPVRPEASHKGVFGHLLAVAGSRDRAGAAVLLSRGALRSGVGLLTTATPESARDRVASAQPEMMSIGLPENAAGELSTRAPAKAGDALRSATALAIGPGLGTSRATRTAVRSLLSRRTVPAVADADALNAFAAWPGEPRARLRAGRHPLVITPHPGEAARLLGRTSGAIQQDRPAAARTLARRTGAVVVLKGRRTLIASPDGRLAINASGNPGMASGGTGDVLTGVIGGFLARGLSAWDAARLGAWMHGDAGDRAAALLGVDGMIAQDLIEQLPESAKALGEHEEPLPW